MSTTGERIKAARIAAGLTQEELGKRVGVKNAAIHKYESGLIVNLKRDTIEKLADVLEVRPTYLMCIDEESPATVSGSEGLTEEERRLLEKFRSASEDARSLAEKVLDLK